MIKTQKRQSLILNKKIIAIILLLFIQAHTIYSQEYSNLKAYQKATGNLILLQGCWLKKDRVKCSEVWENANLFNLSIAKGNTKYTSISQIQDFYSWIDKELIKQGHQIKWAGIASHAAKQLSKVDNFFIRVFIVRNKELVTFVHEGSTKVFSFAFLKLKDVYFSKEILQNEKADDWDKNYGVLEQCEVLEPLYQNLSKKSLKQLNRMAKGKGIYSLGVPNALKFEGELTNCHTRYAHGMNKIYNYYLQKK